MKRLLALLTCRRVGHDWWPDPDHGAIVCWRCTTDHPLTKDRP